MHVVVNREGLRLLTSSAENSHSAEGVPITASAAIIEEPIYAVHVLLRKVYVESLSFSIIASNVERH